MVVALGFNPNWLPPMRPDTSNKRVNTPELQSTESEMLTYEAEYINIHSLIESMDQFKQAKDELAEFIKANFEFEELFE